MVKKTLLITCEGIDGCGKSTQAALLRERLTGGGIPSVLFREPGGTGIGEKIRAILLDVSHAGMSPEAELFLYLAARAQITGERIRPALAAGKTVIMDRFIDSTSAYQGAARGLGIERVRSLNLIAANGLVPDITLLFDCEPAAAFSRLTKEHDRLEAEGIAFMARVRDGFLSLASAEPSRFVVLDAGLPVPVIAETVYEEVMRRFS